MGLIPLPPGARRPRCDVKLGPCVRQGRLPYEASWPVLSVGAPRSLESTDIQVDIGGTPTGCITVGRAAGRGGPWVQDTSQSKFVNTQATDKRPLPSHTRRGDAKGPWRDYPETRRAQARDREPGLGRKGPTTPRGRVLQDAPRRARRELPRMTRRSRRRRPRPKGLPQTRTNVANARGQGLPGSIRCPKSMFNRWNLVSSLLRSVVSRFP